MDAPPPPARANDTVNLDVGELLKYVSGAEILGFSRPTLSATIQNLQTTALLDTGAAASCISLSTFKQLMPRPVLKTVPSCTKLRGAGGHALQVAGVAVLELQSRQGDFAHTYYVIDGLTSPVILGYDAIAKHRLQVLPPEPVRVRMAKKTKVEGNSISLLPIQLFEGDALMQPGADLICTLRHETLSFWPARIVTYKDEPCLVAAINTSAEPVFVRGELDATIERTSENMLIEVVEETPMMGRVEPDPPEPPKGDLGKISSKQRELLRQKLRIGCPEDERREYENLLLQYADVFSHSAFDLGRCDTIQHSVRLRSENPIHMRQFRIPWAHEAAVHKYVDELLKLKALEVSRSPYNSAIFCVPKKLHPGQPPPSDPSDGLRVVLDYRAINAESFPDKFVIREIKDCIDDIGRAQSVIFSSLDLAHGFYQLGLEPGLSRECTAFTVPGRGTRYQWTVTPMGLQGSPGSFARLMGHVLGQESKCLVYIDDCLCHAATHPEMRHVLGRVLHRLRQFNLKLHPGKSQFGTDQTTYLGYKISREGIRPSDDKVKALSKLPLPSTVTEVRSFLGLANYFRFLIKDFARLAGPLHKIQGGKNRPVSLDTEQKMAFEALKNALTKEPVVVFPRSDLPFKLTTDAATGDNTHPGGLGAVLTQYHGDGKERVVAYASRTLATHEKNYSPFLLELAAAVFGLEHFSVYLRGRKFDLYLDHKPLEALNKTHTKTFNRLQELMGEFNFRIHYVKGKDNVIADHLSRNVPVSALTDESGTIAKAQARDPFLADLISIKQGKNIPDNSVEYARKVERIAARCSLSEVDNILWYRLTRTGEPERDVVVAPAIMRDLILQDAHSSWESGHPGEEKTRQKIEQNFWWPGIATDVTTFVQRCVACQARKGKKPQPVPVQKSPIAFGPNDRIHLDLFSPGPLSVSGNRHILVVTDAFTKYTELVAIPDKNARTVAEAFFDKWVLRHSVPHLIIHDGGREFENSLMADLRELLGVERIAISPYSPWVNSAAESFNREIIRYLKLHLTNSTTGDWERLLGPLQFAYNTATHKSTSLTPFFMTYKHDPRLGTYDTRSPRRLYDESDDGKAFQSMRRAFALARDNLEKSQAETNAQANKTLRPREFKVGDSVWCEFPKPPNVNQKFFSPWRGPFKVLRKFTPVSFEIADDLANKPIRAHANRLRLIKATPDLDSALPGHRYDLRPRRKNAKEV